MTTDKIDHAAAVAAASRAVEEAWPLWGKYCPLAIQRIVDPLLATRRAAQAAGYVECMLSKEAVEAFDDLKSTIVLPFYDCSALIKRAIALLARDLGSQINRKS